MIHPWDWPYGEVRGAVAGLADRASPASATLRPMTASEADSIERFVGDLRHLWVETGRTQFTAMARHVDVSKSSLNDAVTRRDRLPSDKTVAELVGYLDSQHVNEWLARRAKLQDQLAWQRAQPRKVPATLSTDLTRQPPPEPSVGTDEAAIAAASNSAIVSRLPLVAALLTAMAVGLAGGFVAGRSSAPAIEAGPELQDGDDPIAAGCVADASPVATRTLEGVGTVRLVFSHHCNAYWSRMDRLDDQAAGNQLELSVYEQHNQQRKQTAIDPDISNNYTFLLVRRDPSVGYCAEGIVWVGDEPTPIPGPVC